MLSGLKNIIPIGGKFGFFDEDDGFERAFEKAFEGTSKVLDPGIGAVKETGGILKDLVKEAFPVKGTINFQEKSAYAKAPADKETEQKQQEAYRKKDFYQRMEMNRKDAEHKKTQQAMEDLARLEVAAMSTTEKNIIEGLNADLKAEYTNNPYHISNIRNKKLEQLKLAKKQQQAQSMAAASGGKNLVNSLDAQEGQSMISASGAIASAG